MKFIFLSLLFILLVFSNAQAQRKNYDKQHITGVFVGLSFSKFTERVGPFAYGRSNTYDNSSSFGFNGAIFHKKITINLLHT